MKKTELFPRLSAEAGTLEFPILFWVKADPDGHLHHLSCAKASKYLETMVDPRTAALKKAPCCYGFKSLYAGSAFASSLDTAFFLEGALARTSVRPEPFSVRDQLFLESLLEELEAFSSPVSVFNRAARKAADQARALLDS